MALPGPYDWYKINRNLIGGARGVGGNWFFRHLLRMRAAFLAVANCYCSGFVGLSSSLWFLHAPVFVLFLFFCFV